MFKVGKVFIDLDMTLVDTSRQCLRVIREFFNRPNITYEEFMNMYYDEKGIRAGLRGIIGEDALSYDFWSRCWEAYIRLGDYGTLMPHAVEMLRGLKSDGRAIFILTGREVRSEDIMDELRYYGFLNLIDGVLSLGDLGRNSNKGDLLRYALVKYNNGSPRGIVYVTDHPKDIDYCARLGILTIGVLNHWNRGILRADYVVDDLLKVRDVLRTLEDSQP